MLCLPRRGTAYLIFSNGGSMNGTTSKGRTLYFAILPANQLDLALFLEADRMRSLEITGPNLAYENFAYQHSVIGSMADLSAATTSARCGRRPCPENELNDHKRAIVAGFALSLESPAARAQAAASKYDAEGKMTP